MKKTSARKSIRFSPDSGSLAEIAFGPVAKAFKAQHHALVLSESATGCSILVAFAPDVSVGDRLRLKVGNLSPLLAEVRWVVPLDEQIQKIGFMYLQ